MSTITTSPARTAPDVTVRGERLPDDAIGLLEDCTPLLNDPAALRQFITDHGWVYLPGYLGRERVMEARRVVVETLYAEGVLDPDHDPMQAVLKPGAKAPGFCGGRLETLFPDAWQPVHDLLYTGPMIEATELLVDGPVRHFDYTWLRMGGRGLSTPAHSDIVYMGRGTHQLFTAWTPLGDAPFESGGLVVLDASNHHDGLRKRYWSHDVDTYCENRPGQSEAKLKGKNGSLHGSFSRIRDSIGGRWLTADYRAGDVVLFHTYLVHGGADNHTDRLRLSSDTRYQPASEPADERWIGTKPVGHGPEGKRGRIC